MRATEIDGNTGILGNLGVLRHPAPLVIRHALPGSQRHTVQRSAKAFHGRGSGRIVHLRQDQVTAFQFNEGPDSRCVALARSISRLIVDGDRSSRAATCRMLKPCARLTWIVARSSMQSSEYDMDTAPYQFGQVLHSEFAAKLY